MLIPMEECIKINSQLGNAPITGVLHIGAHAGEECESYVKNGIKEICWIEANKVLFKDLYQNTCKFPAKQQYICQCLSGLDDQKITFNITNNGQSSSMLKLGTHKQHHPQVHVVETRELITKRFDTLYKENMALIPLENHGMINLDTQGSELQVLKGFGNLLSKYNFQVIYSEVNKEYLYEECCLVEEIDEYLNQFGFKRVLTKWTEYIGAMPFISENIMTSQLNNIRLFHKGQTFGGPQKVVDNLTKGLQNIGLETEGSFSSRGARYNGCLQHPLSSCPNDKDYEKSFHYHGGRKLLMGPNLFVIPNEDPKLCSSFDHFIVPSQWVLNLYRQFKELDHATIDVWSVGIDTEKWQIKDKPLCENIGYKCLIYFKGRSTQDLELTKNLLKHFKINYQIVEYGKYTEEELWKACNWANFCILLTGTESQGIAYLEILSTNLPCYVLNKNYWNYDGKYKKVPASSVPYFDERCGMIIDNAISISHFKTFLEKLDTFKPREYILENFTLEKRAQEYYDLLVKYQG